MALNRTRLFSTLQDLSRKFREVSNVEGGRGFVPIVKVKVQPRRPAAVAGEKRDFQAEARASFMRTHGRVPTAEGRGGVSPVQRRARMLSRHADLEMQSKLTGIPVSAFQIRR